MQYLVPVSLLCNEARNEYGALIGPQVSSGLPAVAGEAGASVDRARSASDTVAMAIRLYG